MKDFTAYTNYAFYSGDNLVAITDLANKKDNINYSNNFLFSIISAKDSESITITLLLHG